MPLGYTVHLFAAYMSDGLSPINISGGLCCPWDKDEKQYVTLAHFESHAKKRIL